MSRAVYSLVIAALGVGGCQQRSELVVFHAASLSQLLSEVATDFEPRHKTSVVLQPSGSQVAARKVSELNLRADLVAVADARVLEEILVPEHALWVLVPATNELVVAHAGHSRHTEEITSDNWYELLMRPEVRLGIVDRDTAPLGYLSLMLLQLAELHHRDDPRAKGLAERLPAKVAVEHVMSDENELLALLATRAIDYALMYRSTAEDHHLKLTRLSPAYNLGDAGRAAEYIRAEVAVRMNSGATVMMRGAPIRCGLTIPSQAPHPEAASRFVLALLDERGQATWRRRGFRPLQPPEVMHAEQLPPLLAAQVRGRKLEP